MKNKKINVGGQAVIEGVMMRGPEKYVVAARNKKGIAYKKGSIPTKKNKFLKMPFVRGFVNLLDMMVIGIKSLMWSAEQQGEKNEKIGKNEIMWTMIVSFGLVILFFIALPYLLTNLIGFYEEEKPILFNLIDGVFRITIFLVYLLAISKMSDVKTLFKYHGAEHMAIHCYEHSQELKKDNVRKFKTLHPRCGTSFILLVFLVSILVFSILPSLITNFYPGFLGMDHWARKGILIPVRILLLPLIAGISYEILKISDKKQNNLLFKLVSMPGLWLQKITTKEPSNKQIEVAVISLKKLLKIEKK